MAVLVTGASRGIGRALADELTRRGHAVTGVGRSWDHQPGFTPLTLDLTAPGAPAAAAQAVISAHGRIDVLVNNAGVSHAGPVEDTSLDTARAVFNTNYFAPVAAIQAALPAMRAQGRGLIVNIASAAGQIGIPFQAHYAASKFALEGLSESLHHELAPLGIKVLVIEPGDVGTAIWERTRGEATEGPAYHAAFARFLAVKAREMGPGAAPASLIAREIAGLIEDPPAGLRHGVPAAARLILLAKKILPERIFLAAVARNYRVKE